MKKMLVKAVALSLVMGGVGFVANNAQAFSPIEEIQLKAKVDANHARSMQNQTQIQDLKGDVATNKDNIQKNANDISDNKVAIEKEAAARKGDIAMVGFKAKLEQEQREAADKKLEQKIDKNATDILVEKKNREGAVAMVDNKVNLEKQERENNDKKLSDRIDAEAKARKDADAMNSFMAGLEKQERENNDKKLDQKITDEAKARDFGDFKLNTKIDAEGQARVENDKILNNKIDKETNDRKFGEFVLNTKIDAEGQARVENDKILNGKIDANKTAIDNEVVDRKAEVSRLDGRIDKLDANVEKVGAMAAAIANLHTMGYDPEAPTEIAVGVGQYRDKTGMALGAFHYPNRDFMLSFSVSTAGDEFMGGIGATWKFGRKSPEELRQAAAEKAAKEVKKTAEKVTKEVKKAAPKTTAKKSAAKKEIKTEVVLQYGEKEVNTKDMIASVKKDWTKQKHKISEIKSIELYVKPEDYAVYYVINGEHTGKVWL